MNTTKPEVHRHCKNCGHVYRYAFQIGAIPRCPKCWGYEYTCVEYVDSKGKVIDYKPYKTAGIIPCLDRVDKGCEIATDFLNEQSKCTACPFTPKCVDDLAFIEKEYLKQWRMLLRVYKLADDGFGILRISKKTGLTRYLIGEWLNQRDFFEPFIKKPEIAGSAIGKFKV